MLVPRELTVSEVGQLVDTPMPANSFLPEAVELPRYHGCFKRKKLFPDDDGMDTFIVSPLVVIMPP